jgi:hypothetical protein
MPRERLKESLKISCLLCVYRNILFLGPASNEVLNSNSGIFLDELRPVLETSLSDLFTNVANKITESFTYNELFPKD